MQNEKFNYYSEDSEMCRRESLCNSLMLMWNFFSVKLFVMNN